MSTNCNLLQSSNHNPNLKSNMKTEVSQKKENKFSKEIKALKKKWREKIAQPVTSFFRKYIELFPTNLYSALLATAIFILLENLLHQKIYDVWINPIMSHYKPGYLVDAILLALVVILIYKLRHSKLGAIDLTILLVWAYFKTLYEYTDWNFYALSFIHWFSYLDIIPAFYALRVIWLSYATKKNVETKGSKLEKGYLYPDLSIDAIHKATGEDLDTIDSLKRTGFAKQLADVLKITKSVKSFVVGIEGPWGSGKTSLIYLITEQLKQVQERTFKIIQFSPWFFNNTDNLIASFFDLLEKEFVNNRNIYHELRKYKKQLLSIESNFLKTDFTSLISEDDSLLGRYEKLEQLLQQHAESLVIVIDDLDRLDRKEVIEVFRLMRAIANFPNVFYLVGYDKNYITDAIRKELTDHSPEKYPDKIFNVEFRIPELGFETLQKRFKTSLEERLVLLDKEQQPRSNEVSYCFALNDYVKEILFTERDIVRFINSLMMRFVAISREVNFYHLFILELIHFKDNKAYTAIYTNFQNIFSQLKSRNEHSNELLDISFISKTQNDITLQKLISMLFNVTVAGRVNFSFPIYEEIYFSRYFILTLTDSQFSDKDFKDTFLGNSEECFIKLRQLCIQNERQLLHLLNDKCNKQDFIQSNASEYALALIKLHKFCMYDLEGQPDYYSIIGITAIFIAVNNRLDSLVSKLNEELGRDGCLRILSSILKSFYQNSSKRIRHNNLKLDYVYKYQDELIQLSIHDEIDIHLTLNLIDQYWDSRSSETPLLREKASEKFLHQYQAFFQENQQIICKYLSSEPIENAMSKRASLTYKIERLFGISGYDFLNKKMLWLFKELYSGYLLIGTAGYHYSSIDKSSTKNTTTLQYGGKYIIEVLPIEELYWKLYIGFNQTESISSSKNNIEEGFWINKTWDQARGNENTVIDFEFTIPINGTKNYTFPIDASKSVYIHLIATKDEFEVALVQYDSQEISSSHQRIPLHKDVKRIKSFSLMALPHQTDYQLDYKIYEFEYIL